MKQFIQCCLCLFTLAQTAPAQNNKEVYKVVDNMPKAPYNMGTYLSNHVQYPQAAIDSGIQGKVYVQFIVETDSSISNVKATRGAELGGGLPAEAERLVREMPKWAPGTQKGVPVRVYFTMPVNFKLEAPEPKTKPDTVIYEKVDDLPSKTYDWNVYIRKNLKYPERSKDMGIQGKVYVRFVVKKDGSIADVSIANPADLPANYTQFAAEAVRVVKSMPPWIPGKLNGVPVDCYFTVPINFRLE
ncbi:energy transducer TonB [Edaphocola flava]|uniref:energy transducer TonB n=1 Tax=Edaphocola flava TaxID=2499629 RepID=UPI00100C186C|nr:energy transducer TonB [Edaphocola flava]